LMIEAVEPGPECEEPEDPPAPATLTDLLVPPAVLPLLADVATVLPVPEPVLAVDVPKLPAPDALAAPVLPAPAALAVPLLPVPDELPVPLADLPEDVPAALLVPEAADTWPDSAWVRVRLALATWPWAVAKAYFKAVVSKVARTCPAVTFWPMVTGTVATFPDTAKDTVAALDGSVVPVACSVCTTG